MSASTRVNVLWKECGADFDGGAKRVESLLRKQILRVEKFVNMVPIPVTAMMSKLSSQLENPSCARCQHLDVLPPAVNLCVAVLGRSFRQLLLLRWLLYLNLLRLLRGVKQRVQSSAMARETSTNRGGSAATVAEKVYVYVIEFVGNFKGGK